MVGKSYAVGGALPHAGSGSRLPVLLALAVAAAAALLALTGWIDDLAAGFGTPEAMLRLAGVRDALAGDGAAGVLSRVSPPEGAVAGWSRLGDAPLLLLLRLLDLMLSPDAADRLAVNLLPPAAFLAGAGGLALTAHRFAGPAGAFWSLAALLPTPLLLDLWRPGALDDRTVVATLAAAALAALVRTGRRPVPHPLLAFGLPPETGRRAPRRAGTAAGVLIGLLAVAGADGLAVAALALVGLCGAWLVAPDRYRNGLAGCGLGLAVATPAAVLLAGQPIGGALGACGGGVAASAALGAGIGLGLAGLARLLSGEPGDGATGLLIRASGIAGLLSVAVAGAALLVPRCLDGGLAAAAASGPAAAGGGPLAAALFAGPIAAAVIGGLALGLTARPEPRPGLLALAGLTGLLGLAAGAGWIDPAPARLGALALSGVLAEAAFSLAVWRPAAARLAVRVLFLTTLTPAWTLAALPLGGPAAAAAAPAASRACRADVGAALAGAAPGLVAAPPDLSAYILMRTRLAVIAAPGTRPADRALAADAVLTAPPAFAAAAVTSRGVAYVAACLRGPETADLLRRAPDGLAAGLLAGVAPDLLEPVAVTLDAVVYRARRDARPGAPAPADPEVTGALPPLDLRPSL